MTHAARSARSTSVTQVQAGTRSPAVGRRRVRRLSPSRWRSWAAGAAAGARVARARARAPPQRRSHRLASVKACSKASATPYEGTLRKACLVASDPNKARNLYAVSPLEYHNEGTGFEAHGLYRVQGDIYVNIATSPEEAAVHLHGSRVRYTEPIPEEIVEKRKAVTFTKLTTRSGPWATSPTWRGSEPGRAVSEHQQVRHDAGSLGAPRGALDLPACEP